MPVDFQKIRRQLTIGVILLLLGFGFVTQIKVQEEASQKLVVQSESDLVEIMDRLDTEIQAMRSDITDLQVKLVKYEASATDKRVIINQASQELMALKILVGLEPAKGSGVEVVITDRHKFLTGFDLHQLIEELRASGARAIALNGQRVDTKASFFRKKGRVYLNGHRLKLPYRVVALSDDGDVLYQALLLPRGIKDKLSAFKGVKVFVKKKDDLFLPAINSNFNYRYLQKSSF